MNTKFRAWDGERKAMVYGADIEEFAEEHDEISCTIELPRYQTGLSYGVPFVAYINKRGDFTNCDLMQFTGILDKNGVEIYEGDVVKDAAGQVNVITFGAGTFWFNWLHLVDALEPFEVLGNIHQHPELLKH